MCEVYKTHINIVTQKVHIRLMFLRVLYTNFQLFKGINTKTFYNFILRKKYVRMIGNMLRWE